MAYRFNNGNGGVTCDICNILIDSNLSYSEYMQSYRLSNSNSKDVCLECKEKKNKIPVDQEKLNVSV